MNDPSETPPPPAPRWPGVGDIIRDAFGGTLMGLANLVPGISGGTMLLAAGVYDAFIQSIADVTTLRFRIRSLATLGIIVGAALVAIALLAGPVVHAVANARWVMYSIFIGLTLGGAPVVWRMVRPATAATWFAAAAGFAAMAALAIAQSRGLGAAGATGSSPVTLFVAGLAGASAMVLPGVSGGYLLLVLGQYVPILAAIDRLKDAVKAVDITAAMAELDVVIPVGLGVVAGVVGVSNLLRFLLNRYEKATLGVLLGLLLGAVVGLWPFQQGVAPQPGDTIKGRVVTAENAATFDAEDWHVRPFKPSPGQIGGSLALILGGFVVTLAVARFSAGAEDAAAAHEG